VPTIFRWYVAATTAAGCGLLVYCVAQFVQMPSIPQTGSFVVLSILVFLGQSFPIEIPRPTSRTDRTQLFTVAALWEVALLVEWGAAAAITVTAVAYALAGIARRLAWWRTALNVAMSAICTFAASAVFESLNGGAEVASVRWMAAAISAGVTHVAINHVLFKSGFALYTGQRVLATVREDLGVVVNNALQTPTLAMAVVVVARLNALLTITTVIPGAAMILAMREQYRRRLAAEEAARNAAELAKQEAAMARRQQELLTQLSHAVRTPLTIVLGACDTLGRRYADLPLGVQQDMVQQALRAARHLTGLVDNVLRAAGYAVQSSSAAPQQDEIDLTVLAGRVVEQEQAQRANIQIELRPCRQPLMVLGDADGLAMIVRNLVENAANATPPGGHVLVMTSRAATSADVAVLAVEDEGPGVPRPERERIFEPFVRLDNYDSGIGLGLHVASAEARLHGGMVLHTDPLVLLGAHAELRLPVSGALVPPDALASPLALVVPASTETPARPPQQIG
jgi:signal transduction histidine kinase